MFLKHVVIRKKGKRRSYWALIESIRTERGPRQRTVAYLGELNASQREGWAKVKRSLDRQPEVNKPWHADEDPVPEDVQVHVRSVRVEGLRDFGDVYLGLTLWRALRLDELLQAKQDGTREEVSWSVVATILALARFCEPSSELHIADTWYRRTALEDLLGTSVEQVNEDRLYRGLDQVLPHKEAIEKHPREQFADLFDAQFDLILYDVTSTYFEGEAQANPQAQRGHSRDKRYDCKQVCIGLVVTRDGLPLSYEVFAGNTNDMKTLKEIVQAMERKHGKLGRIWVVDRGIASEENLEFLRKRGAHYVVGTPKNQLKKFETSLLEAGWSEVEPGVEVKICPGPDGTEMFVLCRSKDRREKEKAMHERFTERIEKGLHKLWDRLNRARKMPDPVDVGKQIGRLLGRNSRAAGLFDIQVKEVEEDGQKKLRLTWEKRKEWSDWAQLSEGSYLLRTNLVGWSPQDPWKTYIQLTQAESAFRVQKSELKIRPIWHQREHRVQAHILFSFLAYAMRKTLEQWMARCGLGNGPRTVLEEIAKIKATNVILPTSAGRDVQLRCVTRPDDAQRVLLSHLGLTIPQRLGAPKWKDLIPKM